MLEQGLPLQIVSWKNKEKNKMAIGLKRSDSGGKIMTQFVRLRTKSCR